MFIKYGIEDNKIDVTEICNDKLLVNDIITIPCGDMNRVKYFSDPLIGTLKKIFIYVNDLEYIYDETKEIKIDTRYKTVNVFNLNDLQNIHNELKIKYGSFNDELPKQLMSLRFLTGNEKVLEIGGNIGRNSLIIAYILEKWNNNNFVSLESDTEIANQLLENRNLNNFNFMIENSALSKRNLIQKDWITIESDVLLSGYNNINIISLEELNSKYNIEFDTLILDCEGAFYYILKDMPELLDNINLIIMENDYNTIEEKNFVDKILIEHNFYVAYSETLWDLSVTCYKNFIEVWRKR